MFGSELHSAFGTREKSCRRRHNGETERVISNKIFVGNLNFATTDEELRQLFGEVGEVVDVHIPKDRETGRPRGFGFVEMAADDAATTAISTLNGHEMDGRALTVNTATLASIVVAPDAASIHEGETLQYTATGTFTDTSTRVVTTDCTWDSTLTAIATISSIVRFGWASE